jgi:hypothetical protein
MASLGSSGEKIGSDGVSKVSQKTMASGTKAPLTIRGSISVAD